MPMGRGTLLAQAINVGPMDVPGSFVSLISNNSIFAIIERSDSGVRGWLAPMGWQVSLKHRVTSNCTKQ